MPLNPNAPARDDYADLRKRYEQYVVPSCRCGLERYRFADASTYDTYACSKCKNSFWTHAKPDAEVIRALDEIEQLRAENEALFMQAARDACEITQLRDHAETCQRITARNVNMAKQALADRDASNRALVALQEQVIEREKLVAHLYWNVLRDRQQGELISQWRAGDVEAREILAITCPGLLPAPVEVESGEAE